MTRDQIIAIAREAGIAQVMHLHGGGSVVLPTEMLARFASLVAAATKERCAQICDAEASIEGIAQRCAANIRGML